MHQAADQQPWQHDDNALIVGDYHPPASRRNIDVIDCRHRILPSVGSADRKRDKWRDLQVLAEIASHNSATLPETNRGGKRRETSSVQRPTFNTQRSTLNVQRSTLNVQRPTFNGQPRDGLVVRGAAVCLLLRHAGRAVLLLTSEVCPGSCNPVILSSTLPRLCSAPFLFAPVLDNSVPRTEFKSELRSGTDRA
jgi:hypothetical protein